MCRPGRWPSCICRAVILASLAALGHSRFLSRRSVSYRQTLRNYQNVQYFGDFLIGGQRIEGFIDSGSWSVLVRGARCSDCVFAHETPPYDHEKSSTYHLQGIVTKHTFGAGKAQGISAFDHFVVGPLEAEQRFFDIMDHSIRIWDRAHYAALVGLAYSPMREDDKTLLMSYGLSEYSVCLLKPDGADGYLTWGPVANALARRDYATAKVLGKHHWSVRLQDVAHGDHEQLCSEGQGCAVVLDTGTPFIAVPWPHLSKLSQQIVIKDDCSNVHELPPLRMRIAGQAIELPAEAYVMRVTGTQEEVDDVYNIVPSAPADRAPNRCVPTFIPFSGDSSSEFGPTWILGMPFFRYFHTTFDRVGGDGAGPELRFARAGPDCQPQPFAATASFANATGNSASATAAAALLGSRGRNRLDTVLNVSAGAVVWTTAVPQLERDPQGRLEL